MKLEAEWTEWTDWISVSDPLLKQRLRFLKIGKHTIATEIQYHAKAKHSWGMGEYFSMALPDEQAARVTKTRPPGFRRLAKYLGIPLEDCY